MSEPNQAIDQIRGAPLPRPVQRLFWVCIGLGALCVIVYAIFWLLDAYGAMGGYWVADEHYGTSTPPGDLITFGIAFLVCAWLVARRKRIAPIAILVLLGLSVGWLVGYVPEFYRFNYFDESTGELVRSGLNDIPGLSWVLDVGVRWLYLIAGIVLMWIAYIKMTAQRELAPWFKLAGLGDKHSVAASGKRTLFAVILAAFVWWAIRVGSPFQTILWGLSDTYEGFGSVYGLLTNADKFMPFLGAAAMFIWIMDGVNLMDEDGARLALATPGWRVFSAPWERIWRVDLVDRGGDPSGSIIHYRAKGWFPFSFTINATRDDRDFLARSERLAIANKVRLTKQRVSGLLPYFAWVLIAVAILLLYYAYWQQQRDWIGYYNLEWPPPDIARIANPIYYGAVAMACACLFGAALGLLSAYHRAGTRPILVILYIYVMRPMFPTHLMHWLVWIAVYAILMARSGQAGGESLLPPTMHEWNVGFFLDEYAVPISALVYVLTIALVVRKQRVAEIASV